MNTPTEQEVEKLAELIQDKMSFDFDTCVEMARWHLSQLAAKDGRIRELEKALQEIVDGRNKFDVSSMMRSSDRMANIAQSALKTKEAGE